MVSCLGHRALLGFAADAWAGDRIPARRNLPIPDGPAFHRWAGAGTRPRTADGRGEERGVETTPAPRHVLLHPQRNPGDLNSGITPPPRAVGTASAPPRLAPAAVDGNPKLVTKMEPLGFGALTFRAGVRVLPATTIVVRSNPVAAPCPASTGSGGFSL